MSQLEHANITVRDVDKTIRFLQTALPDLQIRHRGDDVAGPWVHIGNDHFYLALETASQDKAGRRELYADPGMNHLGFVVDDVEAVRQRLTEAGYRDSTVPNQHPFRKRVYFYDDDGNDFEFIEYHSDDPAERHAYHLDP